MPWSGLFVRWIAGIGFWGLVLVLAMDAEAQTAQKDKDKADKKKSDQKADSQRVARYLDALEQQFRLHDLNNNGFLSQDEITRWLGLGPRAAEVRKADTDGDKLVSKDEFQVYATQVAEELAEEDRELEEAIAKYEAALAKAAEKAREQYRQALQRYRQQLAERRDRQRFNDRYRNGRPKR